MYNALYQGFAVVVTCERRVPGGIVCDVKKHASASKWPWLVTGFTTAKTELETVTS